MENENEVEWALYRNTHEPVIRVLGPEMGGQWRARSRPAFALTVTAIDAPVVGQRFGLPSLPADVAWPMRQGWGPMTHMASIDCSRLPEGVLDLDLPDEGTLLFFCWTMRDLELFYDQGGDLEKEGDEYFMGGCSRDPGAGCAVLYVPASAETSPRPAPEGMFLHDAEPLRFRGAYTSRLSWEETTKEFPVPEHLGYPLASAFDEWENDDTYVQIGGHIAPVNSMHTDISTMCDDHRGTHGAEGNSESMVMLAAIDHGDEDMETYWFIRPDDLAQRRFDGIHYTYLS
ncbi:DUF1963 domain-containing protein [Streptomyces sp. SID7982]|nr:DUF1963 domain-containing protein [Streptomyces sp. SID7982]